MANKNLNGGDMKKFELDRSEIYNIETGETIANIGDLDIEEINKLLEEQQLRFV